METNTQQQKASKGMSSFSVFETIISGTILFTLFAPLCKINFGFSIGGVEAGKTFILSYFDLVSDHSNVNAIHYLIFILPIVNIITKFFFRTSWLSALTILSAISPIMIIEDMKDVGFSQMELSIPYYLAWMNTIGMSISVFVSCLLYWGNRCKNYKRLFAISAIITVCSFGLFYFSIMNIKELFILCMISLTIITFGILLFLIAIVSICFNYKKKEKTDILLNTCEEETPIKIKTKQSNKKLLIGGICGIVLIIGISIFVANREHNFEVQLPVWKKFIQVETYDVNLRKAPDTDSPKLMEQQYDMDSDLVWSDEPAYDDFPRTAFHLNANKICPVLSETDEWYEILVQLTEDRTIRAYIMKRFCKEVTPIPIDNITYFYKIPKGKFKNKYLSYDAGGVFAESSSLTLGWEVDGGLIFPKAFKHSFADDGGPSRFVFNLLTEEMLEQWFGEISKNQIDSYDMYYNFAGAGLQWYHIDLDSYSGELK